MACGCCSANTAPENVLTPCARSMGEEGNPVMADGQAPSIIMIHILGQAPDWWPATLEPTLTRGSPLGSLTPRKLSKFAEA
jgi:hypothetical protein